MAEQLKQETLISKMKEEEEVPDRSFTTKEVPIPPGWVIINCDEDNKPLEVTVSNRGFPFYYHYLISTGINDEVANIWEQLQEHGKSRFVAWHVRYPGWAVVKSREEDEPVLINVSFCVSAPSRRWITTADEEKIVDYISGIFKVHKLKRYLIKSFEEYMHNSLPEIWEPQVIALKYSLPVKAITGRKPVPTLVRFGASSPSHEWVATGETEKTVESLSRIFDKFEWIKPDLSQHMAVNYYPSCPEPELTYGFSGHTDPNDITILLQDMFEGLKPDLGPRRDSNEIFGKDKHKTLPKSMGGEHHTIDMPDDSHWGRLAKEEKYPNLRGNVAMLCTGVSAQNILSLVGGSGSMSIPEPIFYSTVAANAIAFLSSSLALLLLKKKANAAGIFEVVGFVSAIATFLLMMTSFLPK